MGLSFQLTANSCHGGIKIVPSELLVVFLEQAFGAYWERLLASYMLLLSKLGPLKIACRGNWNWIKDEKPLSWLSVNWFNNTEQFKNPWREVYFLFQTKTAYQNDEMRCHQSTILTLTSLYFATKGTPVLVNFFFSLLAEVSSLFLLSSKERQRGFVERCR